MILGTGRNVLLSVLIRGAPLGLELSEIQSEVQSVLVITAVGYLSFWLCVSCSLMVSKGRV